MSRLTVRLFKPQNLFTRVIKVSLMPLKKTPIARTNASTCTSCREWSCPRYGDADGSGTRPIIVKLIGVVPGGQRTTQFNMMVHDYNLTMENDNEGQG